MTTITITRKKKFVASLVPASIYINKLLMGTLKNGETQDFQIEGPVKEIAVVMGPNGLLDMAIVTNVLEGNSAQFSFCLQDMKGHFLVESQQKFEIIYANARLNNYDDTDIKVIRKGATSKLKFVLFVVLIMIAIIAIMVLLTLTGALDERVGPGIGGALGGLTALCSLGVYGWLAIKDGKVTISDQSVRYDTNQIGLRIPLDDIISIKASGKYMQILGQRAVIICKNTEPINLALNEKMVAKGLSIQVENVAKLDYESSAMLKRGS